MFDLWSGIYPSFAEAPATGPGFAGERWFKSNIESARAILAAEDRLDLLDLSTIQRNAALPSLVAHVKAARGSVRILDIGGGFGSGYVVLRGALSRDMHGIVYNILEIPEVSDAGEQLLCDHGEVRFLRSFPEESDAYDVVYAASALQYIDDWQGFLATISGLRAEYILLSDVVAGAIESFVTLQNYYESKIPVRFINDSEFLSCMAQLDYQLSFRLPCITKILGEVGALPMSNFPADRRIRHAWHFLFHKQSHR